MGCKTPLARALWRQQRKDKQGSGCSGPAQPHCSGLSSPGCLAGGPAGSQPLPKASGHLKDKITTLLSTSTPPSVISPFSMRQVRLSGQPTSSLSSQPWHSSTPPPWSTQASPACGLQGSFGLASDHPGPAWPHFVARITGRESLTFHPPPRLPPTLWFPPGIALKQMKCG